MRKAVRVDDRRRYRASMLPAAPLSDYVLLTVIIFVGAAVPLIVAFFVERKRRQEGKSAGVVMPRWVWWALPLSLVAWWFVSAWLFLND